MQIKDENGKIIANIDLSEGYSLKDLIRCTNKKSNNKCLENLEKIEESENKKQIVFRFRNGNLFYDLPTKNFLRENGTIVGENSLRNFKLNINNKDTKVGRTWCTTNNFWLELTKKTDVVWIKTFFKIVDVWANKRFTSTYLTKRECVKRCKLQRLSNDKKFFDCVESFAKLDKVQFLASPSSAEVTNSLNNFYKNINDISKNVVKNEKDCDREAIYINIGKSKLDNWFLSNMAKPLSKDYCRGGHYGEEVENTLSSYLGDYIKCVDNNIKDLFQYVYENYRGAIAYKQIEKIKSLIKFGYEPKRLMDYLYRDISLQGLDLDLDSNWSNSIGALGTLYDYAKMSGDMELDYEKYPRYLSTYHDVVAKNYEVEKNKVLCKKFAENVKILKKNNFEYSDEKYCIILPKSGDDLIKEGHNMKHCVASYYGRFADKETIIVFMRNKEDINQSLVTIEIGLTNKIIQAKGAGNKMPAKIEMDFVEKYQKHLKTLENPFETVV